MAPNNGRGLTKSAAASLSLPSFLLSFHACHPCWSPAPLHFNSGSAPLARPSVCTYVGGMTTSVKVDGGIERKRETE